MIDFSKIITGFNDEQARNIAYYLTRYFKGSPHLEKGGKDIFSDVFESEKDESVRSVTLKSIEAVEKEAGLSASKFDNNTVYKVLNAITKFEESITGRSSDKSLAGADRFFSNMTGPGVNISHR
ncbi:hypothetical protein [Methylobacterium trifolii]|uniref:hypothetical protein n=1 Tax=Methylobacterium trifolii TaxID=1003092 RepID=UPI001EE14831|nr:hypothetical protein [Methylobacterium trifolii]